MISPCKMQEIVRSIWMQWQRKKPRWLNILKPPGKLPCLGFCEFCHQSRHKVKVNCPYFKRVCPMSGYQDAWIPPADTQYPWPLDTSRCPYDGKMPAAAVYRFTWEKSKWELRERERDENAALESETETAYRRFGTWRVLGQRISISLALSKGSSINDASMWWDG